MHNARFRLMTAVAGATMCLFAATTYGQNTSTAGGTTAGSATTGTTTGTTGSISNQTGTAPTTLGTQPGTTTGTGTTPIDNAAGTGTVGTTTTDAATTAPSDATTTTTETRRGFPWGLLGLLGLIGLMKRGETTEVRRDTTYTTTGARTVGTASDDRMNLQPRAASGTGTGSTGGTGGTGSTGGSSMGDPNRR